MDVRHIVLLAFTLAAAGCYGSDGGEVVARSHAAPTAESIAAEEPPQRKASREADAGGPGEVAAGAEGASEAEGRGETATAERSGLSSGEMIEMGEVGLMPIVLQGFGDSASADCDFDDPFGNCQ